MAFFSRSQSNAVKIVNPNTQDDLQKPQLRKDSVQRQCRNIMIYGSCKYQDKGCVYYHPPATEPVQSIPRSDSPATGPLTAQAVNAPVFVPKATGTSIPSTSSPPMTASRQSSVTSPSPPSPAAQQDYGTYQVHDGYENHPYQDDNIEYLTNQMEELDPRVYDESQYRQYPSEYDGMDTSFFAAPPVFMRQPLNYHLYTLPLPSAFVASTADSHFVPPSSDLRQILQSRSEAIQGTPPLGSLLPEELQGYHTLVPLEETGLERRKFGNWYSTVYRAVNASDGVPYALRRVENYRLMHQSAFAAIEVWSKIRHPNIVWVREAFTTRAFGDNSMVISYAYHANAKTLFDAHLKPKPPVPAYQMHYQPGRSSHAQAPAVTTIPERTIWSYVVQIASAIKKVHDLGYAVRMIDVTKILVTGQNRIRISSCGLIDVLTHDTPQDIGVLQQEDFAMFGRLLFALCCNNVMASNGVNFQKGLDLMARTYSVEIKNLVLFLVKGGSHRNIDQLLDTIRGKVLTDMDDALMATDRLETELTSELENARLVRLLCKFGFINERPEFAREPRWSETGDRYIIKLFRDFVFHQVDENNNPVVNLSHVLTCLNKLDAGTEEKIMLVARDEQSCLVVSYKEIRACVDAAFMDLARASSTGPANTGGYMR